MFENVCKIATEGFSENAQWYHTEIATGLHMIWSHSLVQEIALRVQQKFH